MKVHRIQGFIQNIFLIEYKHGCLLLDGASRADFTAISEYFDKTLKRPMSDLKVVLVTHMHPDHAGCAHKLRQATGCLIVTGRFDKQWYQGIKGQISHAIDITLAYWVANRLNKDFANLWYSTRLIPDAMLKDGDEIPLFPDWRVVETPGHTDRDISLVNDQAKMIYVADLIVKVKGQYRSPFPVHLPHAYRRSLLKLERFIGYEMMMAHVNDTLITQELITHMLNEAPVEPRTNYRALKAKFDRINLLRSN